MLCALRADAQKGLPEAIPLATGPYNWQVKEGEEPIVPKADAEALEILRRKFRRTASVLNSFLDRFHGAESSAEVRSSFDRRRQAQVLLRGP